MAATDSKIYGKKIIGITRVTFAIDPDGRIKKVYRKIQPEPYPAEILADLPDLSL
jgi:peroxiredoxin Q/BCP